MTTNGSVFVTSPSALPEETAWPLRSDVFAEMPDIHSEDVSNEDEWAADEEAWEAGAEESNWYTEDSPQAWASGALFYLLQAMLGIDIDGRSNTVRLDRPHIPAWLEHVELEDLAVGSGRVSLRVSRDAHGAAAVMVIANSADANIEAV